jgi:hypothetical protein
MTAAVTTVTATEPGSPIGHPGPAPVVRGRTWAGPAVTG